LLFCAAAIIFVMHLVHGVRASVSLRVVPMLHKGQLLRPVHPAVAEREWGVPGDAVGTVLCAYHMTFECQGPTHRVDVRFGPRKVVWGAPADQFAPLPDGKGGTSEIH
jgi:hypothetical protein